MADWCERSSFFSAAPLRAFRDHFLPASDPWPLAGWDGSDPCDTTWDGITCVGSEVKISIEAEGLVGSLPSAALLQGIEGLSHLRLAETGLSGVWLWVEWQCSQGGRLSLLHCCS